VAKCHQCGHKSHVSYVNHLLHHLRGFITSNESSLINEAWSNIGSCCDGLSGLFALKKIFLPAVNSYLSLKTVQYRLDLRAKIRVYNRGYTL